MGSLLHASFHGRAQPKRDSVPQYWLMRNDGTAVRRWCLFLCRASSLLSSGAILLRFSANGPLVGPAKPSNHGAPFIFPLTPRSPAASICTAISAILRNLAGTADLSSSVICRRLTHPLEFELELILSLMPQKPVLRGLVGVRV